jgi:hypothetical protein
MRSKHRDSSPLAAHSSRLQQWLFSEGKRYEEVRSILAAEGVQTSCSALSNWYRRRQAEMDRDAVLERIAGSRKRISEVVEQYSSANGEFDSGLSALIKEAAFTALTDPAADRKTAVLMCSLALQARKQETADQALQLDLAKFQRDTCRLFLEWIDKEEAKRIATGSGDQKAKIEALGPLLFGADWKGN